jgi:aspartate kinase
MSEKPTLVMKFGGAAVSSPERFRSIAEIILSRKKLFPRIVVVVSAMGDTTDDLLSLAQKVNPNPPRRELDMLLSVGERISVALLAMALDAQGHEAISYTGSQSGIITSTDHADARIVEVRPRRLLASIQEEKIVIVAGFQGMSTLGEITTLGRGGSDTTAVALGVALDADKVEFYKDVPGVFNLDPKKYPQAKLLPILSFSEAAEIMNNGAQVLQHRCISLAERNSLPLHVLPFENPLAKGTWIGPSARSISNEKVFE